MNWIFKVPQQEFMIHDVSTVHFCEMTIRNWIFEKPQQKIKIHARNFVIIFGQ